MPSEQVGARQIFNAMLQFRLWQSEPTRQFSPFMQGRQSGPPQSLSVSVPF